MSQTRYLTEAYNSFVTGCKSDGIWDAIKAACVMAGWDGLAGGLTPIKGAAPTNVNFVAGDWNRKTGLVGNGSTKYLNSNRLSSADAQDDFHLSVYQSAAASSASDIYMSHIGAVQTTPTIVGTQIAEGFFDNKKFIRCRSTGPTFPTKTSTNNANGLQGLYRAASGSMVFRAGATGTTYSEASASQSALNYYVLAQNNDGSVVNYSNARLSFYSIGTSLNLSLLEARVTRLMDDIAFVINYGLSPLAYNPDAINWANRVVDAGATVSSSTLTAVNTFCNAVDAAGIRDRFARLNLFAGSSLTAALVPLYRSSAYGGSVLGGASDTNNNFVSGDYAETGASGGLKGNGSTKYLGTGLTGSVIPIASNHMSVYFTTANKSETFDYVIGGGSVYFGASYATLNPYFQYQNVNMSSSVSTANAVGHFIAGGISNAWGIYRNGSLDGSSTTVTSTNETASLSVFAANTTAPSLFSDARLGAYSFGGGFTATQAAAYYTALQAFQTALGRNK